MLCGNHRIRLTDGEQAVTLRSEEGEHTYLFTNFLDAIYDEQIWKVMRYELNEYDITFSITITNDTMKLGNFALTPACNQPALTAADDTPQGAKPQVNTFYRPYYNYFPNTCISLDFNHL